MRILRYFLWIILVAAALVVVGGGLYLKNHGFSAREKPAAFEELLARNARRLASPPNARSLKNPLEATPLGIAEGRDHFADHCAVCHANNGSGNTQINAGLYPPAPDMRLAQ